MRSATITFGLAVATASLLLTTGCSSTTTGSGVPTGAGPSATASAGAPPSAGASKSAGGDQTFGAPRVKTPLDTTKYQQNPCSALTAAQQQQFGVTAPGKPQATQLGPQCIWTVTGGGIAILFAVRPNPNTTQTGLANVYEANPRGSLRQLPDLDGLPEVGYVAPSPTPGECFVFVGATDSVEYQLKAVLSAANPSYANPCVLIQQLAQAATTTMKAGV